MEQRTRGWDPKSLKQEFLAKAEACEQHLHGDVKKIIEENLISVRGQIWLTGEIPVFEETYVWVSEGAPQQSGEKT